MNVMQLGIPRLKQNPGGDCGTVKAVVRDLVHLGLRQIRRGGPMMLYCRLRAGVVLALVLCPKVGRLRNVPGGKLRTSDVLTPAPVRCEGPTCTDHANALPYGIQLGHTMRNGSPSQLRFNGSPGVAHRIPSHNLMPTREVLAAPPLRTVSTHSRFQHAGAAVKVS